jgi:hypothetical protein
MVNDYIKKSYKARVVIERVRARTMLGRAIIGGVRVTGRRNVHRVGEHATHMCAATHRRVRPSRPSTRGEKHQPTNQSCEGEETEPLAGVVRVAEAVNARELARRHATDTRGGAGARPFRPLISHSHHVPSPRSRGVKAPAPASQARQGRRSVGPPSRQARHRFARNNGFFPPATFLLFAFCFFPFWKQQVSFVSTWGVLHLQASRCNNALVSGARLE